MIPLKIQIGAVGDPPLFPEADGAEPVELIGVAIIEKATSAQRTGVTLVLKQGDKWRS